MKLTKILVALSFLFAVSSANAGELTVTGNMEATYQSYSESTTGNPIGMDRELKFAGSTELDNGITVSVMQDTSDNLAFGNSQIAFGNIGGMATVYVGSDSDPVDAIDDITPSAYEEANGSGSGTYNDIGDLAGEMGIGIKVAIPVLGALNAKYYPKADATKNSDNAASADANNSIGSGSSISLKMNMADLPVAGSYLDGATLTGGYSEKEVSTQAVTDDQHDATVALNYAFGAFSFGLQKKYHNEGQLATNTEEVFYKDTVYGVVYALNDALSISYNRIESDRHDVDSLNPEQSTDAINIGYSIGGMTIGLQDASTDNAGYVLNAKDDTKTIGVSVAF